MRFTPTIGDCGSDLALIRAEVTKELAQIIQRFKADDVLSPYLIHCEPKK